MSEPGRGTKDQLIALKMFIHYHVHIYLDVALNEVRPQCKSLNSNNLLNLQKKGTLHSKIWLVVMVTTTLCVMGLSRFYQEVQKGKQKAEENFIGSISFINGTF